MKTPLIRALAFGTVFASLCGSVQGQAPVDKTPKLHLSFDSVSGTTVLNGGAGGAAMNGTLNGSASIVAGGKFGNCLSISGANANSASCRIASSVVPLNGNATWTVAMWIQTSTAGGCYAYQGNGGWDNGNTSFYLNQGNGSPGSTAGGVRWGQNWVSGTSSLDNGAWHHIVVTCNGSTRSVYVDGVQETTGDTDWGGNGTGNQFWIGGNASNNDGAQNLNGLVDEAYVFDQALSLADIQQLYTNNTIPKVPVTVAVNPTSGYRGQVFTVTATATPAVGTVTNARVNLSAIGLSATATLAQSSPNVFTNTFTVPNNTNAAIGAALLTATVISTEPLVGSGGATFTVKALPPTNAIVLAQLTNTTVYQYTEASFRFGTTNDAPNQAPWPMTYSWYKNNVLVSTNPMGSSFTFLTVPADNGAQIYSIARVADTNYSSISVTSAVVTLTLTSGTPEYPGLKQELFTGASRADAEIGNVARGVVGVVTNADSAGGFGDNHSRRYSGYFIPPTTDGYVFFLASDDDCDLFLSTSSDPANKQLIAQETSWSGTRAWQSGGSILSQKRSDQWTNSVGATPHAPGINLTAGQKYYIEAVMHNGAGGDNWAMTYQTLSELALDSSQPLDGSASRMTVASNNIVFATFAGTTLTWSVQPQPVTVYEGTGTNFTSLAVSDAELSPLYQWYLNTGSGFTPVSGATGPTMSLGTIPSSYDGAQVRVVANIPLSGLSITSSPVTITVLQSVTEIGFLKLERWNGASLAQLRSGSLGTPNFTMAITAFGGSVDNPSGQDNFGRRISGYFIPATTGNYVFFTTGDDETDLFVSTDATPANKRLVCQNAGWNNGSMWAWGAVGGGGASASQMRSDQWSPDGGTTVPYAAGIPLTAGQKYYIEQLFHQGGGGANNAATFKLTTEADPVAGQETRLKGNLIAMNAIRCDQVTFTQQPANVNATAMGYATFAADGTTDSTVQIGSIFGFENPQAGYLFFQWYKNGVAIPGANSRSITLGPLLPSDNGATIYCAMRALGFANNALTPIWTNSVAATVTISGQSVFEPGVAWVNWWSNTTSRVTVENGSAGQPTYSFVSPSFESPWNGASWDNYVNRVHAYFTPTNNDTFVFFVNSDDDSSLFISSNSSPANKFLIAQETGWSGALNWSTAGGGGSTTTQKRSDSFTPDGGTTYPGNPGSVGGLPLTAGQMYWLEAVHHDGAFGDNFAATYKSSSAADPADGTRSSLTGNLIGTYVPRIPWVAFLQQPASQSVTSGGNPVTFSVQGTNPPSIWIGTAGNPNDWLANPPTQSLQYQWYRNGTPIPGATSSSYTLPFVLPSDQGAQFFCAMRALGYADNSLNRIFSNSVPAVLTVVTDSVPPMIAYAATFANTNQPQFVVNITFNEWMDAATLNNAANYTIAGVTITNITVDAQGRTVRLLVNQLPTLPLNVTVNGVKDLSGNTIAVNSTAAVNPVMLTFTDVGTPTVDPVYPSLVSVSGSNAFIITAQGSDIWNASDAFNFAWEPKTNGFDAVVRVVGQGHTDAFAKAGLMVRESLDPASRHWSVFAFPAPDSSSSVGANNIDASMRDTYGGASAGWKTAGNVPPAYPNAWLRLKRTGNVLTSYASSNMVDWVVLGTYDTTTNVNGVLPAEVYLGIATTAHGNDGVSVPPYLYYNRAEYADYTSGFVPAPPKAQLTISRSGSNVTISWTPTGGHLEWSPAIGGPGVNWQSLGTGNPAIVPIGSGMQFFRVVNP